MITDDSRRAIGKVVSVAADKLVIELLRGTDNFTVMGFDDVHYIAQLGSFIIVPTQAEYVVCEVVGLREKDPTTSQSSSKIGGELDKAISAKFIDVVPVGTLPQAQDGEFRFGVSTYPSLYADALYVVDSELDRIFDVAQSTDHVTDERTKLPATRLNSLSIGTSVVFKDYAVKVRVNEFFGGHSAILGNTGSGKSCTIASILQSIFEKSDDYAALGATFVFLDVNGEYRKAFANLPNNIGQHHFSFDANIGGLAAATTQFRLPHWFMSVEEWELLLRASERTQQPVLRTALGLATFFSQKDEKLDSIRNHILACCIRVVLQGDLGSGAKKDTIITLLSSFSTPDLSRKSLNKFLGVNYGELTEIDPLNDFIERFILESITLPSYINQEFPFADLGRAMELALLYEEAHGNRQIRDYCSQMLTRFKWIRDREEFGFLRSLPSDLTEIERKLESYVERFLGCEQLPGVLSKKVQIVVIDMNEAADEVVEVASSVIARLLFERLRKSHYRNQRPVNLVLEEAHRYIAERPTKYAIDSSRVFERIAKEGRKYGLFLTVSSQRPSELSKTVLSQCSNFVIHRIQNPDDLQHIRQMTPFISESVLKRLPSLPKQHALIFGNAVNIPTTFRVRDVNPKPKSDDSPIRDLWFIPGGEPTF